MVKQNILNLFFLGLSISLISQNVDLPQVNPRSSVGQRVGLTYITIEYSSLVAKNPVFGYQVPFGKQWGAGARENTTIEFTNDVLIQGKEIKAGKYGLYMVPNKDKFKIQFSKYHQSLSQTYPTEDEIVLSVEAMPENNSFTKWLNYNFIDRQVKECTVALEWENVRIPIKIEIINPNKILIESLKSELKGRGQFLWGAYSDAANYINGQNIYPDQALEWVNKSLELERNEINLETKASILMKKEADKEEVRKLLYEAVPIARNPWVLNKIVYKLIKIGDTKKAVEAAEKLVNDNEGDPNIWTLTDTLAEAYLKDGNKKKAIKYYKIAKSKAPENQYGYFDKVISELENI